MDVGLARLGRITVTVYLRTDARTLMMFALVGSLHKKCIMLNLALQKYLGFLLCLAALPVPESVVIWFYAVRLGCSPLVFQ